MSLDNSAKIPSHSSKFIELDPPGTWLLNQSLMELTSRFNIKSFIEVGCGNGKLSKLLLQKGMHGHGIDFSKQALKKAENNLKEWIKKGTYTLLKYDIMKKQPKITADLVFSIMVMEHIKDDNLFIQHLSELSNKNGIIVIGVPAREECWGIEDDTAGHFRRYDRQKLEKLLLSAHLKCLYNWSIGVPVCNILLKISNYLIRRSNETLKKNFSLEEQTKSSGIRYIPYKTVFPKYFHLLLNKITMQPFFLLQRLFYNTNLGIMILTVAKKINKLSL